MFTANEQAKLLAWTTLVLKRIHEASVTEYIIVAGDFNKRLATFNNLAAQMGLSHFLDVETRVHQLGGHLYYIFHSLVFKSSYNLTEAMQQSKFSTPPAKQMHTIRRKQRKAKAESLAQMLLCLLHLPDELYASILLKN